MIKKNKITPVYRSNYISLSFSSNNNFIKYAGVMIESIIQNSKKEHNYDIIILHKDISSYNMKLIKSLVEGRKNFCIRFVNTSEIIGERDFYIEIDGDRLTEETYYRLYLQDILSNKYEKTVYLDADMVANKDLYQLTAIDLENYYIAAVRDYVGIMLCYKNSLYKNEKIDYFQNEIGLKDINNYFNAGFLIINLKELRKKFDSKKLEQIALKKHWKQHDQDVLNHICKDNKVKLINPKWNVTHHGYSDIKYLPHQLQNQYYESEKNPYIIHYAGSKKPWKDETMNESDFWFYAISTPFLNEIVSDNATYFLNRKTVDLSFFDNHNITKTQDNDLIKKFVFYLANNRKNTKQKTKTKNKTYNENIKELLQTIEIKTELFKKYEKYLNEEKRILYFGDIYNKVKEFRNHGIKDYRNTFFTNKKRIKIICTFLKDYKEVICKKEIIGNVGTIEYKLISKGTYLSWFISLIPNSYYIVKETLFKNNFIYF